MNIENLRQTTRMALETQKVNIYESILKHVEKRAQEGFYNVEFDFKWADSLVYWPNVNERVLEVIIRNLIDKNELNVFMSYEGAHYKYSVRNNILYVDDEKYGDCFINYRLLVSWE